jgi:MEMO1 family protein
MSRIGPAAVKGHFYPAGMSELQTIIDDLLREALTSAPAPKAFIAPHAGYIFSGPVAASAWARLRECFSRIRRMVGHSGWAGASNVYQAAYQLSHPDK